MDGRADRSLLLTCLLISGVLVGGEAAPAQDGSAHCFITANRTDSMIALNAIVQSPSAISGTFRLVVSKRNGGGTSETVQQGQFDLTQGGERRISTTAFEAAAEGHMIASLKLKTNRGDVSCSFRN